VSELANIAELLKGGELLLATGFALPQRPQGLARYIKDLAGADAAGIALGLGPRFVDSVPPMMLAAAEESGLPLILLRRFTRFVDITEDVHSRIVDVQVEELRESERIHTTFTELVVEGMGLEDVVHQVANMAGCPVVLENLVHQVLAYDAAGRPADEVIGDWEARSRSVRVPLRTGFDQASGWLVSSVGARGKDWGRLLLQPPTPSRRLEMLAERAAVTLALGRLVERDAATLEMQARGTLLSGLLSLKRPSESIAVEAQAAGIPLHGRRVVGAALRLAEPSATDSTAIPGDAVERIALLRGVAENASAAAQAAGIPILVGLVEDDTVAVLISLPLGKPENPALTRWAKDLRSYEAAKRLVIGVGPAVTRAADIRGSLVEATQVAAAAARMGEDRLYFANSDLGLRGLLQLLRDDTRLQSFAERHVAPLLDYDRAHGTTLESLLRAYFASGRNKKAAAELAHVSRPWMYERLTKVESILGVDLESAETCVCLQVALMALEVMRNA
jgi:purine catabolism regulator